ncbi:hypothetical protein ATHL_00971 [Anaerolinea thermolimosa]|uniref:hypothetical protein n=1 Tax=Anaerolinea thermolimosa TaxID=229919 RepID=UPI0007859F2E|nr:hypothetical protein [Anaerolinea thermolimosa]GAP06125.1 hypothetical protein ATHL_00971 [Anaerolinea thermolimosa]
MGQYKTLPISHLRVNPQNPRYRNPQISEPDAIMALFREIKNKPETALRYMLNLIDDIVKNGINPADLPIVVPDPFDDSIFQVMEGNRRIASLKLLYFPDLAVTVFRTESRVLKRLEELRKNFLDQFHEQYQEVLCVVYPTPEEANHWIYLRHTGENEGRGVTPWDKIAKDHFRLRVSAREHTIATQIVKILTERGYLEPDLPVVLSTLERMVKDPDVSSRLNIEIEEGEIRLPHDPQLQDWALRVIQYIALDTVNKDPNIKRKRLTSRDINQKQERVKYLDQVLAQIPSPMSESISVVESKIPIDQLPQSDSPENTEPSSPPPVQTPPLVPPPVASILPSRPSASQDYKKRRQIAAKGIKIQHSTLNHLYQELCQLEAESYPNVGIMGIRAFLEGSLDIFIQKFASEAEFQDMMKNPTNSNPPFNIRLSTKLSQVVEYLGRQKTLTVDLVQALNKYQSDQNNPLSVNTLQAYLHNPVFEPRGDTAKYWWDAYHPLFEALWNTYNSIKR